MHKSRFSICLIAVISSVLIANSPAFAHNELVGQSPSGESTVEAGAIDIRLDFSEAPIATEFGSGNLIAIADFATGEQLGPACARVDGSTLYTTVNITKSGTYKILWRNASDDGHIASGDYLITVENTLGYASNSIGNQCFDDNGVELKVLEQELLSKTQDKPGDFVYGLIWAGAFIIGAGAIGAFVVLRRTRRK
jgi:methionine-rich copper-binding protein CopC